jgi:hypothetical protein
MGRPNDLPVASEAGPSTASNANKRPSDTNDAPQSKRSRLQSSSHDPSAYTDDNGSAADALEYLFLLDPEHRLFDKNLKIFMECIGPDVGVRYSVGSAVEWMTAQVRRKGQETGDMDKAKLIHKRVREEWITTILTLLAGHQEEDGELKSSFQYYQINGNNERYLMKVNILPVHPVEEDDDDDDDIGVVVERGQDENMSESDGHGIASPAPHQGAQGEQRSVIRVKTEPEDVDMPDSEVGVGSRTRIKKESDEEQGHGDEHEGTVDQDANADPVAPPSSSASIISPRFQGLSRYDDALRSVDVRHPDQVLQVFLPEQSLFTPSGRFWDHPEIKSRFERSILSGGTRKGFTAFNKYNDTHWIAHYQSPEFVRKALGSVVVVAGMSFELESFQPSGSSSFFCNSPLPPQINATQIAQQLLSIFPDERLNIKLASHGRKKYILVTFEQPTDIDRIKLELPYRTGTRTWRGIFYPANGSQICKVCREQGHASSSCPLLEDVEIPGGHRRLLASG